MKKRPVLPVIADEIVTDREEILTLLKERAPGTRLRRTMSIVLLGHRRVGKTEALKRLSIRLLMTKFDGRTVEGERYFGIHGDVVLPKFMWVDSRMVKTPSTPEYQIDVVGMVIRRCGWWR